jgi:hypothetical protein
MYVDKPHHVLRRLDTQMLQRRERPEKVIFPPVIEVNGRLYNWRTHIEWYKAALVARALGQEPRPLPTRPVGDSLVPVKVSASELGVGRRTIGRHIRDQRTKPVAAE